MFDYIVERVIAEGKFIVSSGATVRHTAAHFGISKSSVHKDVTERLKDIDLDLYKKVRKVLKKNLSERHIRGGMATKKKYSALKKITKAGK
jgi:putative DeoR family transcriptional regulator (stage III sporulation protein D)